jgi:COP9 signalosome complex subunit 7
METERELEDLVISAIYAGLVEGTLDPYNCRIQISSVSPLRDLPPHSIPSLLTTLSNWSSRCSSTLLDLERQIASIKAAAAQRAKEEAEWNAHVEKLCENRDGKGADAEGGSRWAQLGKRGGGANKRGGNGSGEQWEEGDGMDVDDEDEDGGEKRGKKRGFGTLSFGK